jgi:prepilin-type N-terminal cleavage/methylation domain-containing protein
MRSRTKYQPISGVTFIELLVVIGIIGILASLSLGAVYKAHAYAKDKTWRLQAYDYCDYIQEHLSRFYQAKTNYPTLSAAELHQRGVFDDRIMDFLSCKHVQYIPFSVSDGDDKIVLRIDDYWIWGDKPVPNRVRDLILMKKQATKPEEPK